MSFYRYGSWESFWLLLCNAIVKNQFIFMECTLNGSVNDFIPRFLSMTIVIFVKLEANDISFNVLDDNTTFCAAPWSHSMFCKFIINFPIRFVSFSWIVQTWKSNCSVFEALRSQANCSVFLSAAWMERNGKSWLEIPETSSYFRSAFQSSDLKNDNLLIYKCIIL